MLSTLLGVSRECFLKNPMSVAVRFPGTTRQTRPGDLIQVGKWRYTLTNVYGKLLLLVAISILRISC